MSGTNPLPGSRTGRSVTPRQILQSTQGLDYVSGVLDAANSYDGANTSYEDELRSGLVLARVTSTKKWVPCKRSKSSAAGTASTALAVTDARAFKAGDTVTIGGNSAKDIVKATDLDAAAATGVALYLHVDELGESPFGHLEAVTAGNADSSFTTLGGSLIKVEDDDAAATLGVAIYFDEDGADGAKLLAAVPTLKDAFILDSAGRAIRIKYDASPGTAGVQLYFDDDGAANTRLLFVSPTNASGSFNTDSTVAAQTGYVTRDTANVIVSVNYSTNTITLTDAATWLADDAVYCDSLAGSEIPRAILGEFIKLKDDDATWRDKTFSIGIFKGTIASANLLADLAAIRATTTTGYLGGILWDDQQGLI